jgi:sterol desaturase/sphingolipid hydroxylase (fatty acid hydroxylase superfamily)
MGDAETPALGTYARIELLRYKEKGAWLALGMLTCAVTYGKIVPAFISALLQAVATLQLPTAVYLTLAVMISHHLCYVLHCLILRAITYMNWSERYRCNPTAEWPWNEDQALVSRTYITLLFNFFVLIPVAIYLGLSSGSFDFPGDSSIPSVWEICRQILFCMCAEDVWSFTFHRINHYRLPYRYIHKKHHEYKTSIGMTAEYAHPCEYLITNVVTCI